VMEFLLINHPLDCPICDQGGECELQDVAMGYGRDVSRYSEQKRVVADKNLGPLIATDMTRCIHCTRCVRFGEEVAGIKELGATGRGEFMQIGTYVEKTVDSELSGNVVDLCPVGALTSKPFRFSARAWEMNQRDAIAAHDCVGSNIHIHTRQSEVMRVVPRENEEVNETWISDRDRYSYEGIRSRDRLTRPMIRDDKGWKAVDWEVALDAVTSSLKKVAGESGADQIGFISSPNATMEEMHLLQQFARKLGSDNLDHRIQQQDFTDDNADAVLGMACHIDDIENANAILIAGSNLRKEQPILAHRVRKAAVINGASVSLVSSMDYDMRFDLANQITASPVQALREFAAIASATGPADSDFSGISALLKDVEVTDTHKAIAADLKNAANAVVLIGSQALASEFSSVYRALAAVIAGATGARLAIATHGANATAAQIVDMRPIASGKNIGQMFDAGLKAFVTLGIEPELDCVQSIQAANAMQKADFVVVMSPYVTDTMQEYADVILPVGTSMETAGTYVNAEGRWQISEGSVKPVGEARPAWKVMRVLGTLMEMDGFDYFSVEEIHDDCRDAYGSKVINNVVDWKCPTSLPQATQGIKRITDMPLYRTDSVVRRAPALQATCDAIAAGVYMNTQQASDSGLMVGDLAGVEIAGTNAALAVFIDERVPASCVYIPSATEGTLGLSNSATENVSLVKQGRADDAGETEKVSASHA